MGFVDKLRTAKFLGYENPNREIDSLLRGALQESMRSNRLEDSDDRFGGGYLNRGRGGNKGYLNQGGGFGGGNTYTSGGRGMPLPNLNGIKGMDVVYDQRPEMQAKQLSLRKEALAQDAKLEEAKLALMAAKDNDDFIDRRRAGILDTQKAATSDWAARNMKPGEMSDREKLAADYANRHALNTQNNLDKWVERRERNEGAERLAGIRGDNSNETATIRAEAAAEAARIRAEATTEAARMRLEASGKAPAVVAPVAAAPVVAPGAIGKELERLLEPGAAPMDEATRRLVADVLKPKVDIPKVPGINTNIKTQGGPVPRSEDNPVNNNPNAPGNQPPPGANPNGRWRDLANGKRVWVVN